MTNSDFQKMESMENKRAPGPFTIVAATSFGVFLSALDASIVNVSLVTIAANLVVSMAEIQWIVLAYLIIMTSAMPLMGKLGDRYGKTRVFQAGMILFIIGSFACALSPNLMILVASRVFQAIGASIMSANGLALVTYYTTPQNRGRAIGMTSVTLAAALAIGPVLGGILSEFLGWPSIFLVNLPIGVIGFIVVAKLVPPTKRIEETRFDTIGAALFFTFLFGLVFLASIFGQSDSITNTVLLLIIVVSFIGFLIRERDFVTPIIPTKVLADKKISTSLFSAMFAYMSIVPITFLFPFFLQLALGFTQSMTGLFLIVHPLVISVTGPAAGFISERVRARTQTVVGLSILLLGTILLGFAVPNHPPSLQEVFMMAGSIAVLGFGLTLFTVANGNFIMTAAPKQYMGVVSALTNISRTTGFSIATALVTTVFTSIFTIFNITNAVTGPEYVIAYSSAVQYTIWVFCILVIAALVITVFRGVSPDELSRESDNAQEILSSDTDLTDNSTY
ncbi:MAG: MFS transporter [Candidatus Thorarchaeota archaeon]|jgi:EmrB/QacA subfamily drug resistance transporter